MSNTPDNNRLDPSLVINVEINVDQQISAELEPIVDASDIRTAVIAAAEHRGFRRGEIGVRVTDDAAIRIVNARHLGHDYETDVISFGYAADPPTIEGELIVSAETARARAHEMGWPMRNEILLYVVHGTLHITGMDDHDADDRAAMRTAEHEVLTKIGVREIARFGVESHS